MNKSVLFYTFLNRIKDKTFLLFYIVGLVNYFILLYFSIPFNEHSFIFFIKGTGPLFLIYYSLISGINGLGKDRNRGYLEILLTKPIKIGELVFSYYITYVFFSVIFFLIIFLPTVLYFGHEFNLTFNTLIISPLVIILFYVSYSIFFSIITMGNMYIASIIILNMFCASIPQINKKLEIIPKILLPQDDWKKLIIAVVLLMLSIFFISKQKKL